MTKLTLLLTILLGGMLCLTGCEDGDDDSSNASASSAAAPASAPAAAPSAAPAAAPSADAQFRAITPSGLWYTITAIPAPGGGTEYRLGCDPIPEAASYVFTPTFSGNILSAQSMVDAHSPDDPGVPFTFRVYGINANAVETQPAERYVGP